MWYFLGYVIIGLITMGWTMSMQRKNIGKAYFSIALFAGVTWPIILPIHIAAKIGRWD